MGTDAEAQKLIGSKKSKYMTTPDFVVLPYYTSDWDIIGFEKDVRPAALNQDELNKLELLLTHAAQINKLKVYKHQYVCVTDQRGNKLVWANCFCHEFDGWRTDIQVVMDGGDCFYSLIINLTTGEYDNLMLNGEA
ncbi:hypothetical protein GCM10022409_37370 [Hymenobacter glaciei]|uniref:Uncharacterized protein n=2 Tax=Hymenobacter glaciei TaxID=877209 RepID=A0ABP7UMK6_9BACT